MLADFSCLKYMNLKRNFVESRNINNMFEASIIFIILMRVYRFYTQKPFLLLKRLVFVYQIEFMPKLFLIYISFFNLFYQLLDHNIFVRQIPVSILYSIVIHFILLFKIFCKIIETLYSSI